MTNSSNGLHPYPAYQPSGIFGLGDIPGHWSVRRLRTVAETRVSSVDKHTKEDEIPVRLCNYVDVYKNDRITEAISFMSATASAEEIEKFHLRRGDVLITKDSESWNDIGVPAFVTEDADNLICGYHLALLRPLENMLGAYLARALQSKALAYQFHIAAKGVTRYGLTHTGIRSVYLPLPPLAEQAAIVRYLDYMDWRIRYYVRTKRKLIALLKEEKQTVINQVVTRGLDPNIPFKPSGMKWLGDVPGHWGVEPLKHCCHINSETLPEDTDPNYVFDYLDISSVGTGALINSPKTHRFGYAPSRARRVVRQGDTILSMVRTYLKTVYYLNLDWPDLIVSTGFAVLRPRTIVFPPFFGYSLQASRFVDQVTANSIGVAYPAISAAKLGTLLLPLPPLAEQAAIVDYIDRATAQIDDSIFRACHQVDLMQEYRTRLIADVVTGKLDVRRAAAQMPNEPNDRDPAEVGDLMRDVFIGHYGAELVPRHGGMAGKDHSRV